VPCDYVIAVKMENPEDPLYTAWYTGICNCGTGSDLMVWVPFLGGFRDYDGTCSNGDCNFTYSWEPPNYSCTHVRVTVLNEKCLVEMEVDPIWGAVLECDPGIDCVVVSYGPFSGTVLRLEFDDCPGGGGDGPN